MSESSRLDTPRSSRRFAINVDPEAAGRLSESFARFLGTGRYLLLQTVFVIIWISLNLAAVSWRWDPYPFILLNLAFSTQAAYAAPLILLAQNRQENRDRVALDEDRRRAQQTKADTEYLARELAALRLAVGEVVTRDYLRRELEELEDLLKELRPKKSGTPDGGERRAKKRKSQDHHQDADLSLDQVVDEVSGDVAAEITPDVTGRVDVEVPEPTDAQG